MKKIGILLTAIALLTFGCKKTENVDREIVGLGGDTWPKTALDTWLYDTFTKPYNIAVKYRWDGTEQDPNFTLVPPKVEQVKPLMEMVNTAWVQPYVDLMGANFIRTYAPKNYVLIGSVRYNSRVSKLERHGTGWQITIGEGAPESFDGVIVAVGAPHAARLLTSADAELAADLGKIQYAGATIAVGCYKLDQISNPLNAFGFVVPDAERRDILAASFSSRKFPGRAPEGCVIIRTFLGGAMRPDLVDASDADVGKIVSRELGEILGLRGEPHVWEIVRWNKAMPQYHLGHLDLVDRIEARVVTLPGFALAGNAYRGVGVPQCIRSGRAAAERIITP